MQESPSKNQRKED
ncbi:unknown protein [Parachlamydia acanthamoebae UV-7]|uniref:Uncharacterized protein n=1 Tax=Parachlamydia acanthamoebae (strain UV7) TaxID=765952 RepID=F8KZZ2_PARAV|nr:unknown protein [Parachlamydia acanthamoebae UV-7]